jgi:hypothetical protein
MNRYFKLNLMSQVTDGAKINHTKVFMRVLADKRKANELPVPCPPSVLMEERVLRLGVKLAVSLRSNRKLLSLPTMPSLALSMRNGIS